MKQKADYFIRVFSGSARDYVCDNYTTEMDYDQLVNVILTEYDSDARQLEAQSELELLTLDNIMEEDSVTTVNVGLDRLVTPVNQLTRYLRSAVMNQKWAEPALSQIT